MDPSFLEVNKLFVISFEVNTNRTVHSKYYLPALEIKDCNFITDGWYFSHKPIKNKTYDNIEKTETGQGDDYTVSCLLDYN